MRVLQSRRNAARRQRGGDRRLSRGLIAAALGVVVLPFTTSQAAFQDMTSFLEGGKAQERWQTYLVPSPAGSIEQAKIAFAGSSVRDRLPRGAGLRGGDGALFSMETGRPLADSPDEARVLRRDKTSRVLAVTPEAPQTPPKAFTAGSILERQSMLLQRPEDASAVRTAFAVRERSAGQIALAMNFAVKPVSAARPAEPERVQLASLRQDPRSDRAPTPTGTQALAYGAVEPAKNPLGSLFDKVLRPSATGFVPPIGAADHAWAATPLPPDAYSAAEQTCLATAIYFEARGESDAGQAAVAQVILNRVRNPTYPKTICGVVYQNRNWHNRCQFSFACDGSGNRIYNMRAFAKARVVADEVTKGEIWIPEVGSATHYHATYVRPRWARAMEKVDKIGRHIFYRTFGGGWD